MDDFTFGQKRDPCESFFKKVSSFFVTVGSQFLHHQTPPANAKNVGVTMSMDIPGLKAPQLAERAARRSLYNKTDASIYQEIGPETLQPVGIAYQTSLHPQLKGQLSASHAKSDPTTGDVFNYNLEFGPKPKYHVFQVSASTQKTRILATIEGPEVRAAYIHSLFLTKRYVILCIWGGHFQLGGARILWEHNLLDAMTEWDGSAKSHWFVVSRDDGLVATYTSGAFFCFHTINA